MTAGNEVVAAIGVFDGVHRGHQALVARVRERAAQASQVPGLVTFDPPPAAVLDPAAAPMQITSLAEKKRLLADFGIERLLVLPFTERLACLPPEGFVDDILLSHLKLAGLVVGDDFRFGAGSQGDVALLRELAATRGFWIEEIPAVLAGGERISSTRLREQIGQGRVVEAALLLGRPFTLGGTVVPGEGLGQRHLVPTANLAVEPAQLLPRPGVYLVEIQAARSRYPGVASVGPAPTTRTGHDRLVEIHLLDFEGDLYGTALRVSFLDWLREVRRFDDLQGLKQAIDSDIRRARERWDAGRDNRLASGDHV